MPQLTKTAAEWISTSKKSSRSIYFYKDKVLDLTQFQSIHPGGEKALSNYAYKDITNILFSVFPHKKEQTLNRLQKYFIGNLSSGSTDKNLNQRKDISKIDGSLKKQERKIVVDKKVAEVTASLNYKKPGNIRLVNKNSVQLAKRIDTSFTQSQKQARQQQQKIPNYKNSIKNEVDDNLNQPLTQEQYAINKNNTNNTCCDIFLSEDMSEGKLIHQIPVFIVHRMDEL